MHGDDSLGKRIKALREARGLTQEKLAVDARLSRIYIQKVESGERSSPSLPALARIAHALGATLRIEIVEGRSQGRRTARGCKG